MISAAAPGFSVPPGRPKIGPGPSRHGVDQAHQAHLAVVMKPERCGQHGFQTDRAILCLGEGQALGIDILRVVRGDDDLDLAAC